MLKTFEHKTKNHTLCLLKLHFRIGKIWSKKQLKTEDIYAVLTKENLEGISVKPYYADTDFVLKTYQKSRRIYTFGC